MTQFNAAPPSEPSATAQRSERSLAFEALWRSLPRDGLLPERKAFDPARAGTFLRNLILVERSDEEQRSLRFRLVGDALNEKVQRNVTGANFLDFVPEAQHAESLESARLICEHPCGIWQLNPVHYERGFSQIVEATIFPLRTGAGRVSLMLGVLEFLDGPVRPIPLLDKAMTVDTAPHYGFIDIGAGIPTLSLETSRA